MLTGVEILLERMKTNPEEFVGAEGGYSKWGQLINGSWDTFTAEEQKALKDGIADAKREHFNGEVMRVLAQGHNDERLDNYLVKPGKIIAPQNLMSQAQSILASEFDKAYAGQNTANNSAWWDGKSPYQQRK
jgi:hypothetical protein